MDGFCISYEPKPKSPHLASVKKIKTLNRKSKRKKLDCGGGCEKNCYRRPFSTSIPQTTEAINISDLI